jgi:serine protease
VFAVGGAAPNGTRASYSNFGPQVDLLAPGGSGGEDAGVYSTHATRAGAAVEPAYGWLTGTSMAAAHFSGVLALMKSVRPSLSSREVRQALEAGLLTVAPFNRTSAAVVRDDDGFGLLDAAKAVAAAKGGIPDGPRLSVTPLSLHFDNFTSSAGFQLRNAGSGSLTVQSVRSTVPWATVTPLESNVDGLGPYRVDVTRGGFQSGTRTGAIEIESSAGSQEILLTASYLDDSAPSRPGKLQVRAVDATSRATVRGLYLDARPIAPEFRFDDVPPGKYILVAGTDMNNDGNLCDPGELCGSYPVASLPDVIDYTGVTVGLEIPIAITALAPADSSVDP